MNNGFVTKPLFLIIIFQCFFSLSVNADTNIGIWAGDRNTPKIALTFDDGPKPERVRPLLDILKKMKVKATFFVVGRLAAENKDLILRMNEDGHEIANHTYSHRRLDTSPTNNIEFEIVATNKVISSIIGRDVLYFRPPGGRYDKLVIQILKAHNMKMVMWDVNASDFVHKDSVLNDEALNEDKIYNSVVTNAKEGSLILMHSGGTPTLKTVPRVVAALRRRGYQFVTVSELLGL
jgi:peptidoglycan-N-acetylglucosamine deacetylase